MQIEGVGITSVDEYKSAPLCQCDENGRGRGCFPAMGQPAALEAGIDP